jgi:hypothetical protein
MATITAPVDEVVGILISNGRLPSRIMNIQALPDGISFRARFDFVPLSIPMTLDKITYENDRLKAQMCIGGSHGPWRDKIINWIIGRFAEKYGKAVVVSYPDVSIDLNAILSARVRGIYVKDLRLQEGLLTVLTVGENEGGYGFESVYQAES